MNICSNCTKRGSTPGDAHSTCTAPANPVVAMVQFASGSPNAPKANPHGVRMGWCMWPLNFDPVWIESCPLKVEAATAQA